MANQSDNKMKYPAVAYVPQLPDPVALQSDRRGRRAAALLAASAVLAFFTPYVPDHFWAYRQATLGYQLTEYIANVYAVVCMPGKCVGSLSGCYEGAAKSEYCGLVHSQLAFSLVVFVAGIVASAMAARPAAIGQPGARKPALIAAVAFLVLLVVLMALTASTLGIFIKDVNGLQSPVVINISAPSPFVGFFLPLISIVLAAFAVHALRL